MFLFSRGCHPPATGVHLPWLAGVEKGGQGGLLSALLHSPLLGLPSCSSTGPPPCSIFWPSIPWGQKRVKPLALPPSLLNHLVLSLSICWFLSILLHHLSLYSGLAPVLSPLFMLSHAVFILLHYIHNYF